jgi:thiosulfate/3-mercaptopyruvate sulfurtransferase
VSHLITPSALQHELPDVTVLDVRWRLGSAGEGRARYDEDHLPGAAFIDVDAELCGPPGAGGRHPLPDVAILQDALRRAGVSADRPVVVYDYGDGLAAARAWWTLRWAGHPSVRVLDGGHAAWIAAGLPTSDGPAASADSGFAVSPGHLRVLDAEEAAASPVLIDARQPPRYRGETEPIDPIAGHIPGAVNVPYADLVEADGRLRSAEALRSRFGQSFSGTAVAAYCGSGITAAHTVLALAEAGIDDAGLYVGSWSHWVTDPSRPISTGVEAAA